MFYTKEQLDAIGFKSVGNNVKISDKAVFYNAGAISIGENTRIDDFCILSAGAGGISIGRNVHIACYVSIIGKEAVTIDDFAGISSKCAIYSSSDDYSGEALSNPTVPEKYTNVTHKPVHIGRHVLIGAGTIVLPGVNIADYNAIGAVSLVRKAIPQTGLILGGNPLKALSRRNADKLKQLECQYLSEK